MVLINCGNVLKDQGRFAEARPILEESLALNRARGDLWCEGVCLESLGSLAHPLDEEEAAWRYYRQSLQVWRSLDERNCIEELITSIAESMSRRGFAETAVTLMAAAERIRDTVGIPLSASRQERSRDHLLRLRELVNPREFDRAWEYGRELPLSGALDLAFEDPKTRTGNAPA